MWLPVDSQRPAHLGAPRPHADHPASVSPRQSLGDLGGDCERPAAALRALHPFLSGSNLTHIEVAVFLRALLRQLRGHVIVLWDGGSIHKGPDVRALLTRCPRLHVEPFPGYAPDLNPDEFVWTHFKATLANGRPDNLDELMAALGRITKKAQKRPELLRSFITASELPAFL